MVRKVGNAALRKIGDIALAVGTIIIFMIWASTTLRGVIDGTARDPRALMAMIMIVGAAAVIIAGTAIIRLVKSHKRS